MSFAKPFIQSMYGMASSDLIDNYFEASSVSIHKIQIKLRPIWNICLL